MLWHKNDNTIRQQQVKNKRQDNIKTVNKIIWIQTPHDIQQKIKSNDYYRLHCFTHNTVRTTVPIKLDGSFY